MLGQSGIYLGKLIKLELYFSLNIQMQSKWFTNLNLSIWNRKVEDKTWMIGVSMACWESNFEVDAKTKAHLGTWFLLTFACKKQIQMEIVNRKRANFNNNYILLTFRCTINYVIKMYL